MKTLCLSSSSLRGSVGRVPVRILCDTSSVDSFIHAGVLPFSGDTATGNSIVVRRIDMSVLSVPLHRLHLVTDLVMGDVFRGVHCVCCDARYG